MFLQTACRSFHPTNSFQALNGTKSNVPNQGESFIGLIQQLTPEGSK